MTRRGLFTALVFGWGGLVPMLRASKPASLSAELSARTFDIPRDARHLKVWSLGSNKRRVPSISNGDGTFSRQEVNWSALYEQFEEHANAVMEGDVVVMWKRKGSH